MGSSLTIYEAHEGKIALTTWRIYRGRNQNHFSEFNIIQTQDTICKPRITF